MKTRLAFPLFSLLLFSPIISAGAESLDPKELVARMVEANGGKDAFYAKGGVEYTYIYRDAEGKEDISHEKYRFDGELSWARYTKMEKSSPDLKGELIQGFDGKNTWVTIDGRGSNDPKILRRADFLRKTNYYWFTMMFKLLDEGLNYDYQGKQDVNGVSYDKVKVTFGNNVGDVQDTYLLYINPETHLVDQFLFTVMDFGRTDPLLMKVEYDKVDGLLIPAQRAYAPAKNWMGDLEADKWVEEISTDIKFKADIPPALFEKP